MLYFLRAGLAFLLTLLLLPATAWAQEHFTDCLDNTVDNANVIIPTDANVTLGDDGDELQTGDEVALFSNDGRCAGVGVWDTEAQGVAVTVASVDSTAEILEGYEAGESLKYRIWRQADNQEYDVSSVSYDCTLPECRSDGKYERDALYEVSSLDASSALPVELTSFEASRASESVILEWKTASETNNSGFKVQHKTDADDSWSTLSFVEGAGTTSSPQSYEYEAEDLEYGDHQFRLAQIDRDGTQHPSKTVEVEFTLDGAYDISEVAPNPVRNAGTFELTVKETQQVAIRLYDVLGRKQRVLLDETVPGDQTETLRLDTGRLPSGQYFVRIEGEDFQVTRRVTIVK